MASIAPYMDKIAKCDQELIDAEALIESIKDRRSKHVQDLVTAKGNKDRFEYKGEHHSIAERKGRYFLRDFNPDIKRGRQAGVKNGEGKAATAAVAPAKGKVTVPVAKKNGAVKPSSTPVKAPAAVLASAGRVALKAKPRLLMVDDDD